MIERRRYSKTCLYCNNLFSTTHKEARFCSKSCAVRSRSVLDINIWENGFSHLNVYILGLISSDGCIYKSHNNGHDYMFISLTSASISILNTLKNILLEFDIHARINKDCRKDTCYLRISRQKDVKKFGEYMYKDANLFLSRKRERFNIFLGTLRLPYKFYKDVLYPILKNIEISCFKKKHLI